MAFIESKIECGTCRGKGSYHGLGIWNRDTVPPQECENCNGKGYWIRQVQINPKIESPKTETVEAPKLTKKEKKESGK